MTLTFQPIQKQRTLETSRCQGQSIKIIQYKLQSISF